MNRSPLALILLLTACTPAAPPAGADQGATAEPAEAWRREALAVRKETAGKPRHELDNTLGKIDDLLDNPDPPAAVGPTLPLLQPGAPASGPAFTLRYRVEKKACRADLGCELAALCPVDTPAGTAPAAKLVRPVPLVGRADDAFTYAELDVPTPGCATRLHLVDRRGGDVVCTARGPALPAAGKGTVVADLGTLGLAGVACDEDHLTARMIFRAELADEWKRRSLLAARNGAPPVPPAEVGEAWRREAESQRPSFAGQAERDPTSGRRSHAGMLADVLDRPDPPAVVGPAIQGAPAAGPAPWPALTVHYRIQRACRAAGSDMGCHLAALCPVETPKGEAPAARLVDSVYVGEQNTAGVFVEKIGVPSPTCELRLFSRDHHGSTLCTARVAELPKPTGASPIADLGTIGLDKVECERDRLAERMLLRAQLADAWKARTARRER